MNTPKSRLFSASFAICLAACAAFTGCSDGDKDGDGVRDNADQCITVAAGPTPDPARPGCPAGDLDRDGILDRDDICPGLPVGNGVEADPQRVGCPKPPTVTPTITCGPTVGDCDSDGVVDSDDQCPSVARSAHESLARRGCPWEDRDGDGVEDIFDQCVADAPGPNPDPENPEECPDYDNDRDGLRNSEDVCDDEAANPVVDGGQTIPDGGLPNDPARPGCLLHPVEDAGSPEDVSAADPDASVTATDADSDSGAAEAAVDASATDVQDASTTTATDVPPANNGATTVIVPVTPPAPVEPTPAPVSSSDTVNGLAVGTLIDAARGRPTANNFCWVSRREAAYASSHPANANCRRHEASCWRRASDNAQIIDCGGTPTPGCRAANGMIFACESGAQNMIVRRCATTTVPCTDRNVADAWLNRHPSR